MQAFKRLGAGLALLILGGLAFPSAPEGKPAPVPTVRVTTTVTAPAPTETITADPVTVSPDGQSAQGAAADVLADLAVKGRAPKTGYSRAQFGQRWADIDHNGCDTRNDILRRDLTGITTKPGTRDCVILTGTLADPYTGATIAFQRGQHTSAKVQIDHVVALSNAWQTGAQGLDPGRRTQLANDPLNLLAVDGQANQQKSDGDAATWLPANKAYRCEYVARQIAVKAKYNLWVTQPEKDAMTRVLSTCPSQAVPN